jgi:multidrug efflux system outer membrane protein
MIDTIMSLLKKIFSSLFIMFLTGCSLGPKFQKPEMDVPEQYRAAGVPADSILNLKWWDLFDDPVLDSLVATALENNNNLLIAASRVEEARAALGFTKADMYPRLDVQGGASRGNFTAGMQLPEENNNFFMAPVLSWEIDFWGKFRRANESAKAQFLASEYGLRTVQIGLIAEVVSTYFQLLDYQQRLRISRSTLESRMESLDIIQKRFNKGIIPEIDLNQAQIQKEIALAAIPVHERLIVKTENGLSVLLGQLPHEIKVGIRLRQQTVPPNIPAGLPSQLIERRPDILQAQYQVKAQNAKIGVAQAMRLPSISLTGILGFASNDLSTLTDGDPAWSVSGSLFGPIFNFNKNVRRVEIEEERTRQALYNYEDVVLTAFREVEDALTEVRTYREQVESVVRKLDAARNAAVLSRERYDKGVTSFLEVLETERTLFDVELELSQLRQQYLTAYVKLYKALGGGWLSEEEVE